MNTFRASPENLICKHDKNQQGNQVDDEPEAATAVEVLEVGGEGSEAGER